MSYRPFGSAVDRLASVLVIAASIAVLLRIGVGLVRDLYEPAVSSVPAQVTVAAPGSLHVPRQREIRFEPSETIGSFKARVGIVEYVDFECPFCATFASDIWPAVNSEYVRPGSVLMVFKQFPLHSHAQAKQAALAAMCAAQQGRLSEMHDQLFRLQRLNGLTRQDLAMGVGLRRDIFDECSRTAGPAIDEHVAAGRAVGISATPSFVIGRVVNDNAVRIERVVVGMQSLEMFRELLDDLLAKTGHTDSTARR